MNPAETGDATSGLARLVARRARRHARTILQSLLELSPARSRLLWRLPPGVHGVALTFDDGPHPGYTPEILKVLRAHRARATFFVVGEQVRRHPDLVRQMVEEGHCVGNHTFSHPKCVRLAPPALQAELAATDELLRAIDPRPGLPPFRPPYGALRLDQFCRLLRRGRQIILWNRESRDHQGATPDEVLAASTGGGPRDILLMHDDCPVIPRMLPELLACLRELGLRTVSLDELNVLDSEMCETPPYPAPLSDGRERPGSG